MTCIHIYNVNKHAQCMQISPKKMVVEMDADHGSSVYTCSHTQTCICLQSYRNFKKYHFANCNEWVSLKQFRLKFYACTHVCAAFTQRFQICAGWQYVHTHQKPYVQFDKKGEWVPWKQPHIYMHAHDIHLNKMMQVGKDGEWVPWKQSVAKWALPGDGVRNMSTIIVPTVDNTRTAAILMLVTSAERHAVITGAAGIGKTSTALYFMRKLRPEAFTTQRVAFSSATSTATLLSALGLCVEKRQARTYGPPGARSCYLLVDDMCVPHASNTKSPDVCEMLRQWMASKGYLNPAKAGEWTSILSMRYIATHTQSNTRPIPERMMRLLFPIHIITPSTATTDAMFTPILRGYFSDLLTGFDIGKDAPKIVECTHNVCIRVSQRLLPTVNKLYYAFDVRHIARVIQGMVTCDSDVVDGREYAVKLWRHECERVFTDMLCAHDDREWVYACIAQMMEDTFGAKIARALRVSGYFISFLRDAQVEDLNLGINKALEDKRPDVAETGSKSDARSHLGTAKSRAQSETRSITAAGMGGNMNSKASESGVDFSLTPRVQGAEGGETSGRDLQVMRLYEWCPSLEDARERTEEFVSQVRHMFVYICVCVYFRLLKMHVSAPRSLCRR